MAGECWDYAASLFRIVSQIPTVRRGVGNPTLPRAAKWLVVPATIYNIVQLDRASGRR